MAIGMPAVLRRRSLRWRLSVSFIAIAVLTSLTIGAVLLPVLAIHYDGVEQTYLDGAAERAVRDLSEAEWKDQAGIRALAVTLSQVTSTRVMLTSPSGDVVADSGSPRPPDPSASFQPLPDPLGAGFSGSGAYSTRSDKTVSRPIQRKGKLLGYVELSKAPAYERQALATVTGIWLFASLIGVLIAALAGLAVSAWLSRPIRKLTEASDRMAKGDLSVRSGLAQGDEVGVLAASFDTMASRVEENVTALRRFVADAAHEIGTPLTALQADLDLARLHAQSADEKRLLGRADEQVRRLESLGQGLLSLSRLEAPAGLAERSPVDLVALARHLADAYASRIEQADLTLTLDLPGESVRVGGYPDKLEAALCNLIDNAIKFTPAGGSISLTVASEAGRAVLAVSDSGVGIPPDELPALFERFHRGRNAAAYPGTGLGLAIVKATADLHGGMVSARSKGRGSVVEIRLPLSPSPAG